MNTLINTLTKDLHDTAEALAASTEARRMMADTIAELQAENAELRAAVARLIGLSKPLTLTDRGDAADGYCVDDAAYESGTQWVMELRAAG